MNKYFFRPFSLTEIFLFFPGAVNLETKIFLVGHLFFNLMLCLIYWVFHRRLSCSFTRGNFSGKQKLSETTKEMKNEVDERIRFSIKKLRVCGFDIQFSFQSRMYADWRGANELLHWLISDTKVLSHLTLWQLPQSVECIVECYFL